MANTSRSDLTLLCGSCATHWGFSVEHLAGIAATCNLCERERQTYWFSNDEIPNPLAETLGISPVAIMTGNEFLLERIRRIENVLAAWIPKPDGMSMDDFLDEMASRADREDDA